MTRSERVEVALRRLLGVLSEGEDTTDEALADAIDAAREALES